MSMTSESQVRIPVATERWFMNHVNNKGVIFHLLWYQGRVCHPGPTIFHANNYDVPAIYAGHGIFIAEHPDSVFRKRTGDSIGISIISRRILNPERVITSRL